MADPITEMREAAWKPLYRTGAVAALAMLVLIPIQALVYFVAPPPTTAADYFALFQESRILGLLSLDLLYMVDIVLASLVLLVLCVALRRVNPSFIAIALFLNLAATAIYFASNPAFEMLGLSGQYASATTDARRLTFLAAGEAMLAAYQGTAYNVSYVIAAVAGLIVALVMLRSDVFGKLTAWLGITMNVLGLIPPTVGTVGLIASLLFLVPFLVWLVLIARRLMHLGRGVPDMKPHRSMDVSSHREEPAPLAAGPLQRSFEMR